MWAFITQLLVALVLLGFFLVSCQNVMHIVKGSLCFLLKHIHQELDKELGENEGLSEDEEAISTRVIRRRVLLKVTALQEAGLRAQRCDGGRSTWEKAPDSESGDRLAGRAQPRAWALRPHQDHPSTMAETVPLCYLGSLFLSCFCPQPASGSRHVTQIGRAHV